MSQIAAIFVMALNNIMVDIKENGSEFLVWILLANDMVSVNTAVILVFLNW